MLRKIREALERNRESKNPFYRSIYFVKDISYRITVALKLRKPTNAFLQTIAAKGMKAPRVFVETGTYHGRTTYQALRDFKVIHTIELSKEWYEKAKMQFKHSKHVTCHHGDSAKVLEEMLPTINEPILFYLDAHYSGGTTAMGQDQNPLLRELSLIGRRRHQDIIFIDDLAQIGKSGIMGTTGHPFYPPAEFDWRNITRESIERALGRKILDSEERDNKLIIWKLGDKL